MNEPNTNLHTEQLGAELEQTFKLLNTDEQNFAERLRKYGAVAWEHIIGAHYVDYEAAQSVHFYGKWHDKQSIARSVLHRVAPNVVELGDTAVRNQELMVVQRPLIPGYISGEPVRIGTTVFGGISMIEFTESDDGFTQLSHTTTQHLGAEAVFGFFDGWTQEFECGQFASQFTSSPETSEQLIGALRRGAALGWQLF